MNKAERSILLELNVTRIDKPASSAMPMRRYQDPAKHIEFEKAKEFKALADALLEEWHAWSAAYRPALGVPGCSPSSRQAQSSKQFQSTAEIAEDTIRRAEMESVEWCVDGLPLGCRQAIGIEMRNREVRARVWRSPTATTYDDALEAILPIMKKRSLLR